MSTREHVTPWFVDEPRPALATLSRRGAQIGRARPGDGERAAAVAPVHREIAAFVEGCLARGERPVSIAGDCCAAIPVVAGLQRGGLRPLLVWLDAHGDFNTRETSPSGFLGGMPLAMLTGRGEQGMLERVGAVPLAEERVYLADARDLDPAEAAALAGSDVRRFETLDALLAALPAGAAAQVHFDCDVIDGGEVPAQAYPVAGGPSAAEVRGFFAALVAKVDVVAVSVCAWHPGRDADGTSERICLGCLDALIGAEPPVR